MVQNLVKEANFLGIRGVPFNSIPLRDVAGFVLDFNFEIYPLLRLANLTHVSAKPLQHERTRNCKKCSLQMFNNPEHIKEIMYIHRIV